MPSYIPAGNFAAALLDSVTRGALPDQSDRNTAGSFPTNIDDLRSSIAKIENVRVQRALLAAVDIAGGDLAKVQTNVEAWFNSAMDRVSGWYKRRTQALLFVIGLIISVAANVNTIRIASRLTTDAALRDAIVAEAQTLAREKQSPADVRKRYTDLQGLGLPIGWGAESDAAANAYWNSRFACLVGWLATAFAITLGAPFWFDVLNKIIVIRSTVKPHEKSPEESSEDRQRPSTAVVPHFSGRPAAVKANKVDT